MKLNSFFTLVFSIVSADLNTDCDVSSDALLSMGAPRKCMKIGDAERCWYTYTPASSDNLSTSIVPLVLDLHGFQSCGLYSSMYTGWKEKADRDGFVLVYPQGTTDALFTTDTCWNAGSCCCFKNRTLAPIDDITFLSEVIADVVASSDSVKIDTSRIYLAGHSNGCMMAQRMASELSDIVAAVCCHAGVYMETPGTLGASDDYRPTPVLTVFGDNDKTVPYSGGEVGGMTFIAAEENAALWATANGCSPDALVDEDDTGLFATHKYSDCTNNATVSLVQFYGVGHMPYKIESGKFPVEMGNATDIDTTEIAKDFCFQFQNLNEDDEDEDSISSGKLSISLGYVFFVSLGLLVLI